MSDASSVPVVISISIHVPRMGDDTDYDRGAVV